MGFNVTLTTGYQYENSDMLKNAAKNIFSKQKATSEETQKILEQTIFDNQNKANEYYGSKYDALKASTQLTLNHSLKETLKYLKWQRGYKIEKKAVLGEIFDFFQANNNIKPEDYKNLLFDMNFDDKDNIFAA